MERQMIFPEIFDDAICKLGKSSMLEETLKDLIESYESLLSSSFVSKSKCRSIAKILDKNLDRKEDEVYLLEQLNMSKREFNKTLKLLNS